MKHSLVWPVGVWVSMDGGALIEWSTSGAGFEAFVDVTIQIRPAGGGTVLDTADYTLDFQRFIIPDD